MSGLGDFDLGDKYGDTTLINYEVFIIGEAVLKWMNAVTQLGHESPASTLDYTTNAASLDLGSLIVRDFVAWTSGRVEMAPGCQERMREIVADSGLGAHQAGVIGEFLKEVKSA